MRSSLRTIFFRSTVAASAVLALAACSSSGGGVDGAASGSSTPPPVVSVAPVTTLAGTDITVAPQSTTTVAPIVDLPTDSDVPIGEVESVTQDLASECAEAVAPIRELMTRFETGLLLDGPAIDTLNAGLAAGRAACETEDWAAFQRDELHGWMYAAG